MTVSLRMMLALRSCQQQIHNHQNKNKSKKFHPRVKHRRLENLRKTLLVRSRKYLLAEYEYSKLESSPKQRVRDKLDLWAYSRRRERMQDFRNTCNDARSIIRRVWISNLSRDTSRIVWETCVRYTHTSYTCLQWTNCSITARVTRLGIIDTPYLACSINNFDFEINSVDLFLEDA